MYETRAMPCMPLFYPQEQERDFGLGQRLFFENLNSIWTTNKLGASEKESSETTIDTK